MTINGKPVEHPQYDNTTNKWYCPQCGAEVNIYDEDTHYYYIQCSECKTLVANRNLMEARSE